MRKMFVIACVVMAATSGLGSMASAMQWDWWHGFHGKYEMTATGICNHSTLGWDVTKDGFKPKDKSQTWAANATIQATVQFNRDGKGSLSGTNFISLLPGGKPVPGIKEYQVSQSPVSASFKYDITNDGEITITTGGGTIMTGVVSRDWKVINLVNANQVLDLTGTPYKSYAIQNMVRVLVRMGD